MEDQCVVLKGGRTAKINRTRNQEKGGKAMQNMIWWLKDRFCCLRNERGAETAEWIVMVALIAVVAFFIYGADSSLSQGLQQAVCQIVGAIAPSVTCP